MDHARLHLTRASGWPPRPCGPGMEAKTISINILLSLQTDQPVHRIGAAAAAAERAKERDNGRAKRELGVFGWCCCCSTQEGSLMRCRHRLCPERKRLFYQPFLPWMLVWGMGWPPTGIRVGPLRLSGLQKSCNVSKALKDTFLHCRTRSIRFLSPSTRTAMPGEDVCAAHSESYNRS